MLSAHTSNAFSSYLQNTPYHRYIEPLAGKTRARPIRTIGITHNAIPLIIPSSSQISLHLYVSLSTYLNAGFRIIYRCNNFLCTHSKCAMCINNSISSAGWICSPALSIQSHCIVLLVSVFRTKMPIASP